MSTGTAEEDRARADALIEAGNRAEDAGQLKEACSRYRAAVLAAPRYARAHLNLGIVLEAMADVDGARGSYEAALALDATSPYVKYNLGKLLYTLGELDPAEGLLHAALELKPAFADAEIALAAVHGSQGRLPEAEAALRRVLEADGSRAGAMGLLAGILVRQERLAEAATWYRRALAIEPQLLEAVAELGNVLFRLGERKEAAQRYRQALAAEPDRAAVLCNLGAVLVADGQTGEAFDCLTRAVALDATLVEAHVLLGGLYTDRDDLDAARRSFRLALALDPENVRSRWGLALTHIPAVHGVQDDPSACRRALDEGMRDLEARLDAEWSRRCVDMLGVSGPFYLAYQEESNLDLTRRYGALCARVMSDWLERERAGRRPAGPRGQGGPIRVGIVSRHFQYHSVWMAIVKGWLEKVDRRRFALEAFYIGAAEDQETRLARSLAEGFHQGPRSLAAWVDTILERRLEVLIYPEIGMDPMTLKLASLRLAPVQAAAWGHPATSGLPTIDYFLSAQDFEPPGAEQDYTERLLALPGIGCHYRALQVSAKVPDLRSFGIDEDHPILLCPGTPYKYAPRDDAVWPEIARRLGRCTLVFFAPSAAHLAEKLRERLGAAFARQGMDASRVIRLVPWLATTEFYGLMQRADVMLDTLGFSGFNTAMQAVECGLPIVTREGRFLRGRLASGILKRMQLDELVAQSSDEYVALAVRVASDPAYRAALRERIRMARGVLFEDPAPIAALEEFLSDPQRSWSSSS